MVREVFVVRKVLEGTLALAKEDELNPYYQCVVNHSVMRGTREQSRLINRKNYKGLQT